MSVDSMTKLDIMVQITYKNTPYKYSELKTMSKKELLEIYHKYE